MIYNCIKTDSAVRTAAQVTAHASHMINRTGALLNYGLGEEGSSPAYQECEQDSLSSKSIQLDEYEYIDEDTEALNKKGRDDLSNLYKNIQKFKDEAINFIRDETELSIEKILDKRCKHNDFNKLAMESLAKFFFSKDHARSFFGIMASYK